MLRINYRIEQQSLYGGCKRVKTRCKSWQSTINWAAPDESVHLGNVDIPGKCSQSTLDIYLLFYISTNRPDVNLQPGTSNEVWRLKWSTRSWNLFKSFGESWKTLDLTKNVWMYDSHYHRAKFFKSASCNRTISNSEIKYWKFKKKKSGENRFLKNILKW